MILPSQLGSHILHLAEKWAQYNLDISRSSLYNSIDVKCKCAQQRVLTSVARFQVTLFSQTDQPANLSGFELQGRSSTNQYVTKFTMGYKSDADQNSPQSYPTDQNPKVLITDLADSSSDSSRSSLSCRQNCLTSQSNIWVIRSAQTVCRRTLTSILGHGISSRKYCCLVTWRIGISFVLFL